jgi:WD40 repeat protein
MVESLRYQVGGSLPAEFAGYVQRQADLDVLAHLRRGEYCYVFNSRQMGKSSLRVRTWKQLEAEGIRCAEINPQSRGTSLTEEQWYGGTINQLISDLHLSDRVDFRSWWRERRELSRTAVDGFGDFIDQILLPSILGPIVIFVEEVDLLLSLEGIDTDGFFGCLQALHERRAEHPAYKRLCFCLLGSATPYQLIRKQRGSGFSMGHPIAMAGFQLDEARPLLAGLRATNGMPLDPGHSELILANVLHWTGGQPFLTQYLLDLLNECHQADHSVPDWVATVVQQQVIQSWQTNGLQNHFKNIQDRLLRIATNSSRSRLLGLYQAVLENVGVPLDDTEEQLLLCLTGLVCQSEGLLRLANPIYGAIFHAGWVQQQLAALRPTIYGEAFTAWKAASRTPGRNRAQHLIAGAPLEEAKKWAKGKLLSADDQTFLEECYAAAEASEEAAERIRSANEQARLAEEKTRRRTTMLYFLGFASAIFFFLLLYIAIQNKSIKRYKLASDLHAKAAKVWGGSTRFPVESLIKALAVSDETVQSDLKEQAATTYEAMLSVFSESQEWYEVNRLTGHDGWVNAVLLSPDGSQALSGGGHSIFFWRDLTSKDSRPDILYSSAPVLSLASADMAAVAYGMEREVGMVGAPFKPHQRCWFPPSKSKHIPSRDSTVDRQSSASPSQAVPCSLPIQLKIPSSTDPNSKTWHGMAMSVDGKLLVAASADHSIQRWRSQQQAGSLPPNYNSVRPLLGHADQVLSVAMTPRGSRIVSGSQDGTARLWDGETGLPTGAKIFVHDRHPGSHHTHVNSVAISSDGTRVLTGTSDGRIHWWDAERGIRLQSVWADPQSSDPQSSSEVTSLALSSNGKYVVSGSREPIIRVWEIQKGYLKVQPIAELRGHRARVQSVAINSNGNRILSGSYDGTVRVWERVTRGLRPSVLMPPPKNDSSDNSIFSLDTDPVRSVIVAGGDGGIKIWKPPQGTQPSEHNLQYSVSSSFRVKRWPPLIPISSARFRPDGKILAVGGKEIVQLYDVDEPSNPKLLSSIAPISPVTNTGDSTTSECTNQRDVPGSSPCIWAYSLAFSPRGDRLAIGFSNGTIAIVDDADSNKPVLQNKVFPLNPYNTINPHLQASQLVSPTPVTSLAFTQDGQYVLGGLGNGRVHKWSVATKRLVAPGVNTCVAAPPRLPASSRDHMEESSHVKKVTSLSVSYSRREVASASEDGTVRVWDLCTLLPSGSVIYLDGNAVSSVAYSPDGQLIATGSTGESSVRIWKSADRVEVLPRMDVCSGKEESGKEESAKEECSIQSIAFLPSGSVVAAGTSKGRVYLLDLSPKLVWLEACNRLGAHSLFKKANPSPGSSRNDASDFKDMQSALSLCAANLPSQHKQPQLKGASWSQWLPKYLQSSLSRMFKFTFLGT